MKILSVVGARPNFVKIAPLLVEMRRRGGIAHVLVHTGQHYEREMSGQLFEDLGIPEPDFNLEVGSGPHGAQTGEIMKRIEPVIDEARPDCVVVVGDVNSTLAAAVTATKLHVPVAHVEAGLRSFDRTMPEEINRIVTDAIAELLFVTEASGERNLRHEGVDPTRIHLVGNVMIDALEMLRPAWEASTIRDRLGLRGRPYGVLTLHRPSNVDDPRTLSPLLDALEKSARELPVLFPVHPRARSRMDRLFRLEEGARVPSSGIVCLPPLGYVDFLALASGARVVLTDSGGLQEETTMLGVPCLTLRDSTERPVTISHGTNRVIGTDPAVISPAVRDALTTPPGTARPPLWDGRAAGRILDVLTDAF